ncbi:MAG: hypothetical protein RL026_1687 [Pseudomonadota bacterium]|jgi:cytochrome c553
MSVRSWSFSVVLSVAGLCATLAPASVDAADAARGKTLAYTCLGCHGVEGYKNAFPVYRVPKLSGQHPEYIVQALKAYQSGERSHATMAAHAASLSDQDMQDMAAYLSGTPVKSAGAGAATVGQPPAAAATCQACHGRDGVGIMGTYPTLTGQYADYIEQALGQYRSGARRNAIMQPFASQLSPADIKAIAAYFSAQRPGLQSLVRGPAR